MPKHNAKNERIKHRSQHYLEGALGYSDATIDTALGTINQFEAFTKLKDFGLFHIDDAREFVRHLQEAKHPKTGKPYSKSTLDGKLSALRKFLAWFAGQPEGRKRIRYGDSDYFRLNRKDQTIARTTRSKRVPSVEEIVGVLKALPATTETERRDRAIIAFTLLTCARVQAIITAKIKHVDLNIQVFQQDAREVRTKFTKTFDTTFFPVGDEAVTILEDWVTYLTEQKRFGPDDPLFPKPKIGVQVGKGFANLGLSRDAYSSTGPIRAIFKVAFMAYNLPPPNPHIFRDTIAQLGEKVCITPEQFKAWSQNMGHEKPLTTFTSYGKVDPVRQALLIKQVGTADEDLQSSTAPTTKDIVRVTQYLSRLHR
jgi:integrase